VALEQIVPQVFELLRPMAMAAGMPLVFDSAEPQFVTGDPALLTGVVLNLVSNAIKYGKRDGEIRVCCRQRDELVLLSVENACERMPEEDLPRLFEAHYRSASVETTRTGWGLGLAFVKRITESHGGVVRVSGDSGRICFEVQLPRREDAAATTNAA